jgi:hypothetical protein
MKTEGEISVHVQDTGEITIAMTAGGSGVKVTLSPDEVESLASALQGAARASRGQVN